MPEKYTEVKNNQTKESLGKRLAHKAGLAAASTSVTVYTGLFDMQSENFEVNPFIYVGLGAVTGILGYSALQTAVEYRSIKSDEADIIMDNRGSL